MKNLKSRKIILTLSIVLAVITGLTFSVNADEIQQINPTDVVGNNTSTKNSSANSNSNSSSNANTNKSSNANTNKNVSNNTNKNTTSYNNTNTSNLPKTGLKDYAPLFATIGAFAVIALIAYKKANYYKDI